MIDEISVMAHDHQLLEDIAKSANRKAAEHLAALTAREILLKKEHAAQSETLKDSAPMLSIAELANIQDALAKLETELRLLHREIAEAKTGQINRDSIDWFRRDFYRLWEALERPDRAKIIDLLIETIGFDSGKGTLKINYRDHGIAAIYNQIGKE